ncbi:hypothetical protein [Candidatus Solirubrobacter pratensis]|nr:hypothetical protein [Candidatus Solirubrobacter pratensis]
MTVLATSSRRPSTDHSFVVPVVEEVSPQQAKPAAGPRLLTAQRG